MPASWLENGFGSSTIVGTRGARLFYDGHHCTSSPLSHYAGVILVFLHVEGVAFWDGSIWVTAGKVWGLRRSGFD